MNLKGIFNDGRAYVSDKITNAQNRYAELSKKEKAALIGGTVIASLAVAIAAYYAQAFVSASLAISDEALPSNNTTDLANVTTLLVNLTQKLVANDTVALVNTTAIAAMNNSIAIAV